MLMEPVLYTLLFFTFCLTSADIEVTTESGTYVVVFEESLYFEIVWPESLMYTYKLRQAKDFGASFKHMYHKMELILADPEDACEQLYNDVSGAVVLIQRGTCSFLTKTKVAESAGALAAIIADNDESNDMNMVDMVTDNTDRVVRIPSFFLLGKDGLMIRRHLYMIGSDYALINIPLNLTDNNIGHYYGDNYVTSVKHMQYKFIRQHGQLVNLVMGTTVSDVLKLQ